MFRSLVKDPKVITGATDSPAGKNKAVFTPRKESIVFQPKASLQTVVKQMYLGTTTDPKRSRVKEE